MRETGAHVDFPCCTLSPLDRDFTAAAPNQRWGAELEDFSTTNKCLPNHVTRRNSAGPHPA